MKTSVRRLIFWGMCCGLGLIAIAEIPFVLRAEPSDADMDTSNIGASDHGTKAVVELFTSQGCSSCPPADRLLGALARNPAMIAVSFPVDYWDYIGWKDTLASPGFTARQKAYAVVRGDGHIYTPQIVVDGRADVVGSDKDEVKRAIDVNEGRGGALSVPIHLKDAAGTLHIEVGPGTGDQARATAGVFILRVARTRTVAIERGENKGRSITYTNVVRAMRKIGDWHGDAAAFDITELKAEDEGYVVLLQQGSLEQPGTILAAAKSSGL